jgi:hypothetical protein
MSKLEALKSELEEISPEIVLKELNVAQYDAILIVLEEAQQRTSMIQFNLKTLTREGI